MTDSLLVIFHEATRTGAPRVLLDLLTHARGRLPLPVAIRLQADGPLGADVRRLAEIDEHESRAAAVVVNGAAGADSLHRIGRGIPTMVYVHEEGEALAALDDRCVTAIADRADRVLCVSNRSSRALRRLGVEQERIEVLPPVVPMREPLDPETATAATGALGIDGATPVVVGCGEAGWRKGADLFVDVAHRVRSQRPARFAWAGRRPRAFSRLLDHDTHTVGLERNLVWLGELDDVRPLYVAAQVLVMPSREDPQPLVPLEAAALGTATAGFAIGGIDDLAAAGAASAVPFPDTVALAGEVVSLLDDPGRRARLSSAAERRRQERHSVEVIGDRFLNAVVDLVGVQIR